MQYHLHEADSMWTHISAWINPPLQHGGLGVPVIFPREEVLKPSAVKMIDFGEGVGKHTSSKHRFGGRWVVVDHP